MIPSESPRNQRFIFLCPEVTEALADIAGGRGDLLFFGMVYPEFRWCFTPRALLRRTSGASISSEGRRSLSLR
jgi:hypothetical protein